jgi:hypothetical protein
MLVTQGPPLPTCVHFGRAAHVIGTPFVTLSRRFRQHYAARGAFGFDSFAS